MHYRLTAIIRFLMSEQQGVAQSKPRNFAKFWRHTKKGTLEVVKTAIPPKNR